jgi:ArsR family transcriptional regulator, arsenate/arsenite/antimonite-responsive transcriptional repressor / arsenate reductase (thioredoxin)
MVVEGSVANRTAIHAALADGHRLEIVDELAISDRSPGELGRLLSIGSNLLAHHLGVLEDAGLVERETSDGDARRRYVRLVPEALSAIAEPVVTLVARHVLFVCSANSARSQLAVAAWNARHEVPATSAGTRPVAHVRPEAVRAAARAGLDLAGARPRSIDELTESPDLVVTVCDVAHEELPPRRAHTSIADDVRVLHWSIPDPVMGGSPSAFSHALERITGRIETLAPRVRLPIEG